MINGKVAARCGKPLLKTGVYDHPLACASLSNLSNLTTIHL